MVGGHGGEHGRAVHRANAPLEAGTNPALPFRHVTQSYPALDMLRIGTKRAEEQYEPAAG